MLAKRNFYINGKWIKPSKPNDFEVIDPSTEEPFAIISLGSEEDTDKAINAAKIAFETWRETSKDERLELLEKFDEIYNRRWDEMVKAQSTEMGAPMDYASETHTKMGADISKNYITILKDFNFSSKLCQNKNKINAYKNIIGLKKYFTGTFLPALDIDVQPSKFGIHAGTRSSFTDTMYEIITVVIGKMKQITANALKFVHIDFFNEYYFFLFFFLALLFLEPIFLRPLCFFGYPIISLILIFY